MIDLGQIVGFDWDDGNRSKSLDKHRVAQTEAEQVFVNRPLLLTEDAAHSLDEARYNALGQTHSGRQIHLTFTLRQRGSLIRVISARDMNRKERSIYAEKET